MDEVCQNIIKLSQTKYHKMYFCWNKMNILIQHHSKSQSIPNADLMQDCGISIADEQEICNISILCWPSRNPHTCHSYRSCWLLPTNKCFYGNVFYWRMDPFIQYQISMSTYQNVPEMGWSQPHALTLIARFMRPTWGPTVADRTHLGPMLAPWSLLSGLADIMAFE